MPFPEDKKRYKEIRENKDVKQKEEELPFPTGAFFSDDSNVAMAFKTKLISAMRCLKKIDDTW